MPYSGSDFNIQLDLVCDRAYSTYFPDAEKNIVLADALGNLIDDKCAKLSQNKIYDELYFIIKTGSVFAITGNQISLVPGGAGITDYIHLLITKSRFLQPQYVTVTAATNATPVVITLNKRTNLRSGEKFRLSSFAGNTSPNGDRYFKKLNTYQFALYTDEFLQVPLSGNGVYTVGGQISRIIYNECKPLRSGEKYNTFAIGTVYDPKYETGDGFLKFMPSNYICDEITADYVHKPTQIIDVTDSATDLLPFFSQMFLDQLVIETAKLLGEYSRDQLLVANTSQEQATE